MIPRVTKAQFSKGFSEDKPAIIVDAIKEWPAYKLWSPDYLTSALRDKRVSVTMSKDGHFNYNMVKDARNVAAYSSVEMAFEEAAKLITSGGTNRYAYVQQQSMDQFPEIAGDIRTPEWIPQEPAVNMWFGYRSVTPLHHDRAENFFAQIYGQKEFTILAPADTRNVYPFPITAHMNHISQVDIDSPDLEKFPRWREATPLRFTLDPGDLLFLPAFWWHHVRTLDVSISLSFWWECDANDYLTSPNSLRDLYPLYAVDRLRATKADGLTPIDLTFASAAALFLQSKHRWGASFLAVAAFDEFLNGLREKAGVPNTPGCPAINLANDIKRSCDILSQRGAISKGHLEIAAHIVSMADQLSAGNEVDVPIEATVWLVNAVQSLPAPPA